MLASRGAQRHTIRIKGRRAVCHTNDRRASVACTTPAACPGAGTGQGIYSNFGLHTTEGGTGRNVQAGKVVVPILIAIRPCHQGTTLNIDPGLRRKIKSGSSCAPDNFTPTTLAQNALTVE